MPNPSTSTGTRRKGPPKESSTDGRKRKQETDIQKAKVLKYATKHLRDALDSGAVLKHMDDVQDLLKKCVNEYGFEGDYFDVLRDKDYCNLFVKLIYSKKPAPVGQKAINPVDTNGPSPHTSIQFGQPTPTTSPRSSQSGSDCDQHSEGSGEEENHDETTTDRELTITVKEGGKHFNITFFDPLKQRYDLLSAEHCAEKRSYICQGVASRCRLSPDGSENEPSVRLTWKYQDTSKHTQKTRSTRFWFVKDHMIENSDIVFGTDFENCVDSDDRLDTDSESDNDRHSEHASDDQDDGSFDGSSDDDDHQGDIYNSGSEPLSNSALVHGDDDLDDEEDSETDFVKVYPQDATKNKHQVLKRTSRVQHSKPPQATGCEEEFFAKVMIAASHQIRPAPSASERMVLKRPAAKATKHERPTRKSGIDKAAYAVESSPTPKSSKQKDRSSKATDLQDPRAKENRSNRQSRTKASSKPAARRDGYG